MKQKDLIFILAVLLITVGQTQVYTHKPDKAFLDMEGTIVTHPFSDNIDSLSGQEILELKDENGITIWFGREIFKDVCMTGQCKMIHLWLFWDGTGNYLGIHLDDNKSLTKADDTEFKSADYKKLDEILRNPSSILMDLKQEDLTITEEPSEHQKVDGITSATDPGLSSLMVEGAIYTCHTLWHTVYGHTRDKINILLEQRVNNDFLSLLFEYDNPGYLTWAIDYISANPEYHSDFYRVIADLIKSDNYVIAQHALDYFQPERLIDKTEQRLLLSVMHEVDSQIQYDIIWKFGSLENTDNEVILTLLKLLEEQKIGIGALNPIYQLVNPEHLRNSRIDSILNRLGSHENAYVRSRTKKLIEDIYMQ